MVVDDYLPPRFAALPPPGGAGCSPGKPGCAPGLRPPQEAAGWPIAIL